MVTTPRIIHVTPQANNHIYHNALSENPDVYERMDEIQGQFQELQKVMKAIKGKDLFGKNAYDLCLVPNAKTSQIQGP